jgi:hypothetical protein
VPLLTFERIPRANKGGVDAESFVCLMETSSNRMGLVHRTLGECWRWHLVVRLGRLDLDSSLIFCVDLLFEIAGG